MKTNDILKSIVILFFVFTSSAQQGINYKAMIKDANGDAIANKTITVQFTILENGTTDVFQESHNITTDVNGIIIVYIGEGTLISGDFNGVDWGSNAHFLNTKIDSGDGLTDMGTTEFKTVPYALYAKTAESVSGAFSETQNLADVLAINNSANSQIKNITDPTEAQDAATKAYVDKLGGYTGLLDPPVAIINATAQTQGDPVTVISIEWSINDPIPGRNLLSDIYIQTPSSTMKFSNLLESSLLMTDIEFEQGSYYYQITVKDYFNNVTIGPVFSVIVSPPTPN